MRGMVNLAVSIAAFSILLVVLSVPTPSAAFIAPIKVSAARPANALKSPDKRSLPLLHSFPKFRSSVILRSSRNRNKELKRKSWRNLLLKVLSRIIIGICTFSIFIATAHAVESIRPYIIDPNGEKQWISEMSKPITTPLPLSSSSPPRSILQTIDGIRKSLQTVVAMFGRNFMPAFFLFGILPAYLNSTGVLKRGKSVRGNPINVIKTQNFLEARPYWDQSRVPVDTYTSKEPFIGKVVSTKRIVGPNATGETCHITINHGGKMPFWEGQSYGVIPPGTREEDNKPHKVRLYSVASSRYGDKKDGKTASLCVRRATYWCPELRAEDPTKKGICSNFLCDTKPSDEVEMTGPTGKAMLLPEKDPTTDYILVATGTGVAPYRAFIHRLFMENTRISYAYKGQTWLFLGVANSDSLLYDDEFQAVKRDFPDNFRVDYALSRDKTNDDGEKKMYIQDKMKEHADEIFTKLSNGAHIFFCGLKAMMPGIEDMLRKVTAERRIDYDKWIKDLKKNKQWHVEVY